MEDQIDAAFLDTDLWQPSEFRACRARTGLTLVQFRDLLIVEVGKLGVPSVATMASRWASDCSKGPQNIVVIRGIAAVLGCSVRELLCPRPITSPLGNLQLKPSVLSRALGIVEYASRLGTALANEKGDH